MCEIWCSSGLRITPFLSDYSASLLLFGEPLSPTTAAALRLLVPHLYACPSAKWINGLEFTESQELGFWERNGYHERGEPWAEEPGGGLF